MKRTRLKVQSADAAQGQERRRALIRALQAAGMWECQVGKTLIRAGWELRDEPWYDEQAITQGWGSCQLEPSGGHELRKRSSGGSLTLLANILPACTPCNGWVETYPEQAHRLGLVVRPGDQTWWLLGADRYER